MTSSRKWLVAFLCVLLACGSIILFSVLASMGILQIRLHVIRNVRATETIQALYDQKTKLAQLANDLKSTPSQTQKSRKDNQPKLMNTELPTLTSTNTPLPPTYTPSITPRSAPDTPLADGIYRVGSEIAIGKWRSTGTGDRCSWERYDDQGEINRNYYGYAGGVITVQSDDFEIELENCGTWVYIENQEQTLEPEASSPKDDGIYLVGVDIAPGLWRSTGQSDDCYWTHNDGNQEIIDNHFGQAGGSMIIHESDFEVAMENCGTWVYEGAAVAEVIASPTFYLAPRTTPVAGWTVIPGQSSTNIPNILPTRMPSATPTFIPTVSFFIPSGKWEYYADDLSGSFTLIVLEISGSDAKLGRITSVGTRYGFHNNPCEVYFSNVPIKLDANELKIAHVDLYGTVVGTIKENDEISIGISDNYCTGSAYGTLIRTE